MTRCPTDDDDWGDVRALWAFRPGITYLNHGSFGPAPAPVRDVQRRVLEQLQSEPMDFFVREFEPLMEQTRERLARFVGCAAHDLVLVENATFAMNVVAHHFPLAAGDEVLLTDHEYGAVFKVWRRACAAAQAEVVTASLPYPLDQEPAAQDAAIVAALRAKVTPRTKLIVVSHITSPTAVILPVAAIGRLGRELGVPVCVDGPHAVATLDLSLAELDCDYYAASCHKWLAAPFGTGFLYVHPRAQARISTPIQSWGRIHPAEPQTWDEEFIWTGTRDPSAYFSIPAAIEFLEREIGLENFRARAHALVSYAREQIVARTGLPPLVRSDRSGYVSMLALPLPPGESHPLQRALRQQYGIEVPIVLWQGRRFVRVSCHLYNQRSDIDRLVRAIEELVL